MAESSLFHAPLLWLVTQPDGSHYIMAGMSSSAPCRLQQEDEDTHQVYDVWNLEDCVFVYPVVHGSLPIYLRRHSWNDDPVQVAAAFFPADASAVTCKFHIGRGQCWKYNFSKSLLSCHNCLGSCLDPQKVRLSVGSPVIPVPEFFEGSPSPVF